MDRKRKKVKGIDASEASCLALKRDVSLKASLIALTTMLLLTLACVIAVPHSAYAEESVTIDGTTYTYWTDSDIAAITSIKAAGVSSLKVPSQLGGKPVGKIMCNYSDTERLQGVKALDLS